MSLDRQKMKTLLKDSKDLPISASTIEDDYLQDLTQPRRKVKYPLLLQNSYIVLLLILVFFSNLHTANCFTLAITSSQIYTGVSANYFFTINSHNNPTNLISTFSDWSPTLAQPFISTYMVAENTTGNGLSCINRISKTIECNITASVFPGSVYPSKIVLKMSGISNPSSTKPYSVSLYLNGTSGSSTQTATLTVTQPRLSSLIIDNYSYEVGKKSSAFVYLTFRNYLASSTFLNITYNTLLTTIDMIQDTSYYVATQTAGLKRLTNWDNPSQGFRTLKMNITNPNFAIPVTIDALQYFIEGGVEYKIEKFTLTLQITPTQYLQMATVSPQNIIKFGTNDNTLSLSSKCEIGALNGPSKNAYFQVTYDNTVINLLTGSTCISSSTNGTASICTLNIPTNTANATNSFLLTKIKSLIPVNSLVTSTAIKIQSWSYFSTFSQFYTTCSASLSVDVQPQVLNPSTTLTGCNQTVGQLNTLTFQINVENTMVGDALVVKGYLGKIVNKTGSMVFSYNSGSTQYEGSLSVAQIINSTRIQFTMSFTNPTHLLSQQPSIQISLMRKLTPSNGSFNTYAQVSTPLNICPVTSVVSNSTNNPLTLTNSSTYKSGVSYTVQFSGTSFQFKDYVLNDYFVLSFKNKVSDGTNFAETDSPFQLNSFGAGASPQVLINSQYSLATQILTSSSLKIRLNSSSVVNLLNDPNVSSLLLTIKSLSNPFFVSDVFCSIKTFNSANLQKESLLTTSNPISSISNSELNVQSSSIITLLESNNTINLHISSLSQKVILSSSYPSITSLYIVVKAPFSCLNTNVNNEIIYTLPALNTSDISISLNNCTLGFFNDYSKSIQVQQYARFSHPNLTQNIKTTSSFYLLRSTCGDQCHICDPNTLKCEQCFNSNYSIYNFYSSIDQKCYSTCPSGTYSASSSCHSCHPICSTCSSGTFDSCDTCAVNYVKNSAGICESTCGSNMYLQNGTCASCHPNCQGCITENECYNCRDGAVLVGSTCEFSKCTHPCQTCEGEPDFCLTCVSSQLHDFYFHENQCLETCPEGTFKWQDSSNSLHPKACMKVQSSNIYFVGLVLSLISLGIGVGIRCCARKKTKLSSLSTDEKDSLIRTTKLSNKLNESIGLKQNQQNISKTQIANQPHQALIENILKQYLQSPKMKIFKLNLLRFMTVLMGYIQIVCAVVILIQGGIYNPKGVNEMIYVGLAGLGITNLIFGIKFFSKVYVKLHAKREKFIEMNLKRKPVKIQIEPEPFKQPVQEQKSDENNQENGQNVSNKQNKQNNQTIDKNPVKSIKSLKSVKSINETIPIQKLQNKKPKMQSQRSSEFYEDTPQEKQKLKLNRKLLSDFDNEMVKELVIGLFSTVFTLRTYNVMRSNLFVIFSNQSLNPIKNEDQNQKLNLFKSPRSVEANSNMALNLPRRNNVVQDITKTEVIGSKRTSPVKTNSKQSGINVIKIQSKEIKPALNRMESQRKRPAGQTLTNNPALQSQSLINSLRPFNTEQQLTKNQLIELKQEYVNKFLHPFYTYIMFASLFVVSLMFGIASAILIFNSRYQNMMIWGIDALIVVGFSFFLNIFDLWKAVNLPKHDQHSQVSSAVPEVNQTMENLKPFEEDQNNLNLQVMNQDEDVNQMNATKKFSTSKKYSAPKGGVSPSKNKASELKGGSIREEQIQIDPFSKIKSPKSPSQRTQKTKAFGGSLKRSPNKSSGNLDYQEEKPPQLKIFDDLEIEQNNVHKFTKAQKLPKELNRKTQYSNGKIGSSNQSLNGRKTNMSAQLISQTSRGKKPKNYKMEDIYLGFLDRQERESVPRQQDENKNTEEDDEVVTVKMESREKLQSIKQSSIINLNSEEQIGENDWRQKPLRLVDSKKINSKLNEDIEEAKE